MIRLVTENGVPVGWEEKETTRPASRGRRPVAARANLDCSVELCAAMALTMVEAMTRCGMARPEQGEHVLAALAGCLCEIVDGAGEGLRGEPYFSEFAYRLETAAVMIREAMADMALGAG